jgi:hypothetical protein
LIHGSKNKRRRKNVPRPRERRGSSDESDATEKKPSIRFET